MSPRREPTSDLPLDSARDRPLGFLLGAAARKLAKTYAVALKCQPVTPSQFHLLRCLWEEDGLQQRDLAERARLDATSTTWLVDQLERAGLVRRQRAEWDRRVVRVWLTDCGAALRGGTLWVLSLAIDRIDCAVATELGVRHSPADVIAFREVLLGIVDKGFEVRGSEFEGPPCTAYPELRTGQGERGRTR